MAKNCYPLSWYQYIFPSETSFNFQCNLCVKDFFKQTALFQSSFRKRMGKINKFKGKRKIISIVNSKLKIKSKGKSTLGCFIGWGICCWRPSQQMTMTMCCTTDENLWLWSWIKWKCSVICFRLKMLSSYASSLCLKLQMQIWLVPLKQLRLISEDIISWNTIQKWKKLLLWLPLISAVVSGGSEYSHFSLCYIVHVKLKGGIYGSKILQSDITLSSVQFLSRDAKALEMIYTAIYLILFSVQRGKWFGNKPVFMIYVRLTQLTCEWFATAPWEATDLALHLQETQSNLCHSHDYDFSSKL